MGTPGVKFNMPKATIVEAIKKHKGVLSRVCKDLDCHYQTIKYAIDADPELKELLNAERHSYIENLCDDAEEGISYTVNQREDLSALIRASTFVLNNQGRKRGYTPPTNVTLSSEQKSVVENFLVGFDKLHGKQLQEMNEGQRESHTNEQLPEAIPDKSQ